MLRRRSLFIHVERFGFIVRRQIIWHTSRLLNMLWLPPPCVHPVRGSNGSNSCNFFQLMRGERESKYFFSGPSSARQRNAIQMALCPFAGGLIMAAGIVSFLHSFGDNPQALASELSYIQVDKHRIVILYHIHQCRPCT